MRYRHEVRMDDTPHTPFMMVMRSARRKFLSSQMRTRMKEGHLPDEGKVTVVVFVLLQQLASLFSYGGTFARCLGRGGSGHDGG